MEWGAIAILSQSVYGIFSTGSIINDTNTPTTTSGLRIWNNSNRNFITGSVESSADAASETDATVAYNSVNGAKASTTGTIYGIYDTAGESWEYVKGFLAPQGVTTVTRTTLIRACFLCSRYMGVTFTYT